MSNFNKVILMGRLTRKPELRYTPKGTPVTDLGIATNRVRNDPQSGERREETTFVDVTFWGKQAETLCRFLDKGRPLFIEGRLSFEQWEQNGQKRSKLKVVGENFQFIDSRGAGGGAGGGGAGESRWSDSGASSGAPSGGAPAASYDYDYQPAGGSSGAEGGSAEGGSSGAGEGLEDSEIPF